MRLVGVRRGPAAFPGDWIAQIEPAGRAPGTDASEDLAQLSFEIGAGRFPANASGSSVGGPTDPQGPPTSSDRTAGWPRRRG
jgi:hypothetical protein